MSDVKTLREEIPKLFCHGCGNYIIVKCLAEVLRDLKMKGTRAAFIGGIGCSGRIPLLLKADSMQSLHGRALPFAIGVKIAKPELKVFACMGDADCASIGLSHFIHAARRNIDIVAIVVNNMVIGMTGGQTSPTTPLGLRTPSSPHGNIDRPLDLCRLAKTVGAAYVARWTVFHGKELIRSVTKGVYKKGFAFIEIISPCPTYFGKQIGEATVSGILKWIKRKIASREDAFVIGELQDLESPEWIDSYKIAAKKLPNEIA